jgi:probable rRNA maturation factor
MPATIDNHQAAVSVDARALGRAADRTLAAVGRKGSEVDIVVVDDAIIRRLNHTYRAVARRTDVLAFPLETPGLGGLVGQIVISAETAARQAARLSVPLELELSLLVTHGVLHLVGYDDRDPVEADLMHRRERAILGQEPRRVPVRLWSGLLRV